MEMVMVVIFLMMTNTGVWSDESDHQVDPVLDPSETDTVTIKEPVTEGNEIELEDSLEGGEEEGDNVALEYHNQPDVTNSGLEDISTEYQENYTDTSFHDLEIIQESLEASEEFDYNVEDEGTPLLYMEENYEHDSIETTTLVAATPVTDIYDTDDDMEVNKHETDNSNEDPTETTSAIPTSSHSPPSSSLIDCFQTVNSSSSISSPSQGTITCSCYGGNRTFKVTNKRWCNTWCNTTPINIFIPSGPACPPSPPPCLTSSSPTVPPWSWTSPCPLPPLPPPSPSCPPSPPSVSSWPTGSPTP